MALALPQLSVLNLTDCQLLQRPAIVAARLRTLHLYNCLRLTAVSVHCPLLELLNLTYCTALASLELRCPRLATLLCAGCKALQPAAASAVLQACPALRSFDLTGCAPPRVRVGVRVRTLPGARHLRLGLGLGI